MIISPVVSPRVTIPLSALRAREGQAVVGPLLRGRSPTRSVAPKPPRGPALTSFCQPYARARARPWSARCYGVARQRDRSRQNSRGARACFSPAFRPRAWVPKNLARRSCYGLLVSPARCGSTGSGRLLSGPRVNLLCQPYAREGQAVVGPLLRGRSPTRSVAPKQPRGSGVLLSGISGSRVGAEESGAA